MITPILPQRGLWPFTCVHVYFGHNYRHTSEIVWIWFQTTRKANVTISQVVIFLLMEALAFNLLKKEKKATFVNSNKTKCNEMRYAPTEHRV